MENQIISLWKEDIKNQEEYLNKQITYLNTYQKLEFIKNYFDKDCYIFIKPSYNNRSDIFSILYIKGTKKLERETLFCDKLEELGLNTFFTKNNFKYNSGDELSFKNNNEGFDYYLSKTLKDVSMIAEYRAIILDKELPSLNKEDKLSRPKI